MAQQSRPNQFDPFFNQQQSKVDHVETENESIKGFPFPLNRADKRGFFFQAKNHEVIKSDLIQLLLTEPGERVMMPSFGTPLKRALFEFNDDFSRDQLRSVVLESISRWEPRIVVKSLNVVTGEGDERILQRMPVNDNVDSSSLIIQLEYSLKENLTQMESIELRLNFNPNNFAGLSLNSNRISF